MKYIKALLWTLKHRRHAKVWRDRYGNLYCYRCLEVKHLA